MISDQLKILQFQTEWEREMTDSWIATGPKKRVDQCAPLAQQSNYLSEGELGIQRAY